MEADPVADWLRVVAREVVDGAGWVGTVVHHGGVVPPTACDALRRELAATVLAPPVLRAFREGFAQPIEDGAPTARPWCADAASLESIVGSGGTLSAIPFHEHSRLLARWVGVVSEVVGWPAYGSVMLGGPGTGSNGLPLHWDDADVLAVQIAGSKRWRVANRSTLRSATLGYVQEGEGAGARAEGGYDEDAVEELTLVPGCALVLPRGVWHQAANGPEGSLHVAVVLRTPLRGEAALSWARAVDERTGGRSARARR